MLLHFHVMGILNLQFFWTIFCIHNTFATKQTHLFTLSHYFSCICTKETKSKQWDFPTIFHVFEGNFHFFLGNNFPRNLLCYFISLQTFPGKLLCHKAFIAIKWNGRVVSTMSFSFHDVMVWGKKFQWRKKVHILWVGLVLSLPSFCIFTLLG